MPDLYTVTPLLKEKGEKITLDCLHYCFIPGVLDAVALRIIKALGDIPGLTQQEEDLSASMAAMDVAVAEVSPADALAKKIKKLNKALKVSG